MSKKILNREINKFKNNPWLYFLFPLLFLIAPNMLRDAYLSYYPFKVLTDVTQPYLIESKFVAVGEINRYLIQATKVYDFDSTIDRVLISDNCHTSISVEVNKPSNFPKGKVDTWVPFRIPFGAKVNCNYHLRTCITYNTGKRNLPPQCLVTENFLITN